MAEPTKAELQQLYNQAILASEQAVMAVGTEQEQSAGLAADEYWQEYYQALDSWETATGEDSSTLWFDK